MAKTCGYCGSVVSDDVMLCGCGYQFSHNPKANIHVSEPLHAPPLGVLGILLILFGGFLMEHGITEGNDSAGTGGAVMAAAGLLLSGLAGAAASLLLGVFAVCLFLVALFSLFTGNPVLAVAFLAFSVVLMFLAKLVR